jgi:tRNA-2-methylthio-N6-dimethylallyladenosine synthase
MGRTPYLQPVHVHADEALIGQVAQVKIERRTANSLHGVLA